MVPHTWIISLPWETPEWESRAQSWRQAALCWPLRQVSAGSHPPTRLRGAGWKHLLGAKPGYVRALAKTSPRAGSGGGDGHRVGPLAGTGCRQVALWAGARGRRPICPPPLQSPAVVRGSGFAPAIPGDGFFLGGPSANGPAARHTAERTQRKGVKVFVFVRTSFPRFSHL